MYYQLMRMSIIAICAVALSSLSACSLWMHTTDFSTSKVGEFELRYNTAGECSLKLDGKYARDAETMVTVKTSTHDRGRQIVKPGMESVSVVENLVVCVKSRANLEKGRLPRTAVRIYYASTEIENGRAEYSVFAGYTPLATINITIGNEIGSGVSIPGGVCPSVRLISNTMSLAVTSKGEHQQFLFKGKGVYSCKGNMWT